MPKARQKEQPLWPRRRKGGTARRGSVQVQVKRGGKIEVEGRGRAARAVRHRLPAHQVEPEKRTRPPGFRFRWHLIPFCWAAEIAAAGTVAHLTGSWLLAVVGGPVTAAVAAAVAAGMPRWPRRVLYGMCAVTAAAVPAWWHAGLTPLLAVAGLLCWIALGGTWLHKYGWRPDKPPAAEPEDGVKATFAEVCEVQKWHARLGDPVKVSHGARYPIFTVGARTQMPKLIASTAVWSAAYGKPMTEVFVEQHSDMIQSHGWLNLLNTDDLETDRWWDGTGVGASGRGVLGRFAGDGVAATIPYFTPMSGPLHHGIAGVTDAGKSAALDLELAQLLTWGHCIPFVLDPQEGQSLPAWRDVAITADGADECLIMWRAINAGMLGRSRYLRSFRWTDPDGDTHKGMGFYDQSICGLPLIQCTQDEMPSLVTGTKDTAQRATEATHLISEGVHLGRKTGVRATLVAGTPSIVEFGGDRSLRSYLRGCTITCLRVDDPGDAHMFGIAADPSQIPAYFISGKRTYGLGYTRGPENRPGTPFRTIPARKATKVAASVPALPAMDEPFGAAYEASLQHSRLDSVPTPQQINGGGPSPFYTSPVNR